MEWDFAVYVPETVAWQRRGGSFFQWHDQPGVPALAYQAEPNVIWVRVTFSSSGRRNWAFHFSP